MFRVGSGQVTYPLPIGFDYPQIITAREQNQISKVKMRFLKYNGLILNLKDQKYILISSKVRKLEKPIEGNKSHKTKN